jgi:hypothetical protein
MVAATTFRAWGLRLGALDQNTETESLLSHLHAFGVRAGALRPTWVEGERQEGEAFGPYSHEFIIVPAFDWQRGQIDFAAMSRAIGMDPGVLI